MNLKIPIGWVKAEKLLVDKIKKSDQKVWRLKREINFASLINDSGRSPTNEVAFIWFYSSAELIEFLEWWHS